MTDPHHSSDGARFWRLAEPLLERDGVSRGTMMGHACLRREGAFVAMFSQKHRGMVLKLPRDRVAEALIEGDGQAFAPNGRVFKEWLLVPADQADRWPALLDEACAFAKKG